MPPRVDNTNHQPLQEQRQQQHSFHHTSATAAPLMNHGTINSGDVSSVGKSSSPAVATQPSSSFHNSTTMSPASFGSPPISGIDNNSADASVLSNEITDNKNKLPVGRKENKFSSAMGLSQSPVTAVADMAKNRTSEAARQLFCGGLAGSVAKTVTAPLSRLTILFQVHSMVTTKEHRPKFAMTLRGGLFKMIERGGLLSLWKGNMTSVLHRFPYSAINFYVYENTLDALARVRANNRINSMNKTKVYMEDHRNQHQNEQEPHMYRPEEKNETQRQVVRRLSKIVMRVREEDDEDDDDYYYFDENYKYNAERHKQQLLQMQQQREQQRSQDMARRRKRRIRDDIMMEDTPASHKFMAGATAGTIACLACYPLDLVRTRLTTQFEGQEHYKGIWDAFRKIARTEGFTGFYSGVGPTLGVAVPNFAISYTVYGTLKEYTLDDELFYNLRKIDADSGEPKLGLLLTVLCGAASGSLGTMVTFPMDTIRRRMQIQSLHTPDASQRLNAWQLLYELVHREGLTSLYRGLTPELLKVIPMVSTMFLVYEWSKDLLNVRQTGNGRK